MPHNPVHPPPPSEAARRWLGAPSGGARSEFARQTPHTRVVLWTWQDRRVVEKTHLDPARASREQAALAPTGAAGQLGASPTLIDTATDPSGAVVLLLEWIPASPALPTPATLEAAGHWLARLHATPSTTPDPLPLGTALHRRWRGLVRRSRRVIDPAALDTISALVGPPTRLGQCKRVFCHRDFTPDNWLWQAISSKLWVLDLEHARPDAPAADLVKLESELFVARPELRAAFYSGYGPPLPDNEMRSWRAWHGLATWTWGMRQGEAHFQRLGARILADLGVAVPGRADAY